MRDKKLNILLIEDNPGDVRLIKEMAYEFEDNTFNIIHAKSFSEGIKKYEEQKYNVVLLDLFLPDSVGLETVSNILRKIKDIPIIILSFIRSRFFWPNLNLTAFDVIGFLEVFK